MTIDKLGNIKNIVDSNKTKSVKKNTKVDPASDKIEISSAGMKAAEEARYVQMVKDTPDVRSEKVQAIKAQIADGTYDKLIDDKVLGMVADKLITGMFSE